MCLPWYWIHDVSSKKVEILCNCCFWVDFRWLFSQLCAQPIIYSSFTISAAAESGMRSTQRRTVKSTFNPPPPSPLLNCALCNHVCKGFMHEQLHTKWQYEMVGKVFIQIRPAGALQELVDWMWSSLFHLCHLFRCKPFAKQSRAKIQRCHNFCIHFIYCQSMAQAYVQEKLEWFST